MKRFILFGGEQYYPSGGANDFIGSFGSVEEAYMYLAHNSHKEYDWWHVFDTHLDKIIVHKNDEDNDGVLIQVCRDCGDHMGDVERVYLDNNQEWLCAACSARRVQEVYGNTGRLTGKESD